MTSFEIVRLAAGASHRFVRTAPKEKLIVCEGRCRITVGDRTIDAEPGSNLDLASAQDAFDVIASTDDVVLVHMCGDWGDETGGSGLFAVTEQQDPRDVGDPVTYPKATNFDRHYHDCDEYWIVWEGRGMAVSEGQAYEVGPGDCIATGMGHHHDFPQVWEPVRAVYFETTLEGAKRLGHLWEHTHGTAKPIPNRV